MNGPKEACTMRSSTGAVLLIALLALVGRAGEAAIVERTDVVEMAGTAELVLVGTVLSTSCRYDDPPRSGRIVTDVTLQAAEVVKGDLRQGQRLVVTTLGGVVGVSGQIVPGAPRFTRGDEVVVFLGPGRQAADGVLRRCVVGFSQGAFFVSRDRGGQPRAAQRLAGISLAGSGKTCPGELEFTLNGLLGVVREVVGGRVSVSGGKP